MNKVVHIFQNVDMRNQHDGLAKLAQKKGVKLAELDKGKHVIFINANVNKIKMYSTDGGPDGVLSYKRSSGGPLNLGMIENIPHCFGADGKIDWVKAEKITLEAQITRALARAGKK